MSIFLRRRKNLDMKGDLMIMLHIYESWNRINQNKVRYARSVVFNNGFLKNSHNNLLITSVL